MATRRNIRDILKEREIELHIRHDDTSLDEVMGNLGRLFPGSTALIAPLAGTIRDLYARAGLNSKAEKSATYTDTYEKVIAATALAINRDKLDLQQMLDIASGGYFEIAIPASMSSSEGHIYIVVEEQASNVTIVAKSEIPGQMFAWGKGTNTLENFFSGIAFYLNLIPN